MVTVVQADRNKQHMGLNDHPLTQFVVFIVISVSFGEELNYKREATLQNNENNILKVSFFGTIATNVALFFFF